MLSKSQKLLLAHFVKENKTIVLAPFLSTVTKKDKQQARENILSLINGAGANVNNIKTLRDVIWTNIRRSTIKKVRESEKIGAGGSGQLSELEETVLDILGQESANLEPVKVDVSEIVFEREVVVCTMPRSILKQSNDLLTYFLLLPVEHRSMETPAISICFGLVFQAPSRCSLP